MLAIPRKPFVSRCVCYIHDTILLLPSYFLVYCMSVPSNSGLRRLVEYDERNSPLLLLLNASTVSNTASEAQADAVMSLWKYGRTSPRM
jgi:hypothetical protein